MNKETEIIFEEMCSRVGAKYDNIDFQIEKWFYEFQWSQKDEKNFEDWLSEHIYNLPIKRLRLLTDYPHIIHKKKKKSKKFANEIVNNYGWKIKIK